MRRPLRLAAGLLAGLVALTACGGQKQDNAANNGTGGRLSIATGNTTGVYYVLGGGYASVINAHLPGYRATAEATGASVENVKRVVSGQSDIAFCLADTAFDAVSGSGSFEGTRQPVRALARVYSNYTHVIVRSDSGINKLEDMVGKKISTGSPKSGTEVIAKRLLKTAGVEFDKVSQQLALPETTDGMKNGSIDGMFWSGGLPTGGVKDLMSAMKNKVKFIDLSPYLAGMDKISPLYVSATISKDVYGTPADVPTIAVPNLLLVRDTMSKDLAAKLTALLFDYKADLVKVHPEAKNINLKTAQDTQGIPLHPGAQQYYNEHKGG
jgi:TRAP transporter TAXI family solute receptor